MKKFILILVLMLCVPGAEAGMGAIAYLPYPPGAVIEYAGATCPAGYLNMPTAAGGAQLVSRTTYAALYAAIGTAWGAGDGSTTFGLPWLAADYAFVHGNANIGTVTVGQVISHTHRPVYGGNPSTTAQVYSNQTAGSLGAGAGGASNQVLTIEATGGASNLSAGARVSMCVKT